MQYIIKIIISIILVSITAIAISHEATPDKQGLIKELKSIVFYADEYPPYIYKEDHKIKGQGAAFLFEIMEKLGIKKKEVRVYFSIWNRAYELAQKDKFKNGIVNMGYTPERAPYFQWVGPIGQLEIATICKKPLPQSFDHAKIIYGVVKDDIGEKVLLERKIPLKQIKTYPQFETIDQSEIDCISFAIEPAKFILNKMGYDFDEKFTIVGDTESRDLYIALNKSIPKAVANSMQAVVNELNTEKNKI